MAGINNINNAAMTSGSSVGGPSRNSFQQDSVTEENSVSGQALIRRGFLWKQGHTGVRPWHRRWFELQGTSLVYYSSNYYILNHNIANDRRNVKGYIDLGLCELGETTRRRINHPYSFKLLIKNQREPYHKFVLAADSESERKVWIDALLLAMQEAKRQPLDVNMTAQPGTVSANNPLDMTMTGPAMEKTARLAAAELEIEKLRTKLDETKKKLGERKEQEQQQRDAKRAQSQEFKEMFAAAESRYRNDMTAANERHRTEMETLKAQMKIVKKELSAAEKSAEKAQEELIRCKESSQQSEARAKASEALCEQLRTKLDNTTDEEVHTLKELTQAQAEMQVLRDSLEEQLEMRKMDEDQHQQNAAKWKQQMILLQQEKDKYFESSTRLSQDLADRNEKLNALLLGSEAAKQTAIESHERMLECHETLEMMGEKYMTNDNQELIEEKQRLMEQLENAEYEADELRESLMETAKKIQTYENEIQKGEKDRMELNEKIGELQQVVNVKEQRIKDIQEKYNKSEKKMQEIAEKLSTVEARARAIGDEAATAKGASIANINRANEAEAERRNAMEQISQSEATMKLMMKQITDLESERKELQVRHELTVSALRQENSTLKSQMSNVTNQQAALTKQRNQAEKDMMAMQEDLRLAKKEVDNLKKELQDTNNTLKRMQLQVLEAADMNDSIMQYRNNNNNNNTIIDGDISHDKEALEKSKLRKSLNLSSPTHSEAETDDNHNNSAIDMFQSSPSRQSGSKTSPNYSNPYGYHQYDSPSLLGRSPPRNSNEEIATSPGQVSKLAGGWKSKFGLEDGEELVISFSCVNAAARGMRGTAYATSSYLCFDTNRSTGGRYKTMLHYCDISIMEPIRHGSVDDAISFTTKSYLGETTTVLIGIFERDKCYNLICDAMHKRQRNFVIFGASIETIPAMPRTLPASLRPNILDDNDDNDDNWMPECLIEWLECNALSDRDVMARMSPDDWFNENEGGEGAVEMMKMFDRGELNNLKLIPKDVSGLLLRWLRMLPVPILDDFEAVTAAGSTGISGADMHDLTTLRSVVVLLPKRHSDVLKRLMDFAAKVAAAPNGIDLGQVCGVLGARLTRLPDVKQDKASEIQQKQKFVTKFLVRLVQLRANVFK